MPLIPHIAGQIQTLQRTLKTKRRGFFFGCKQCCRWGREKSTRECSLFHGERADGDAADRCAVGVGLGFADGFEHFESANDFAKDGVFAAEGGQGVEGDEKLAAIGGFVGVDRVAETTGGDRAAFHFAFDFGGDGVARASGAEGGLGLLFLAAGVASLHQFAGKSAVEGLFAIKFASGQLGEVGDGLGCVVGIKLDDDGQEFLVSGKFDGEGGGLGVGAQNTGEKEEAEKGKSFHEKKVWKSI